VDRLLPQAVHRRTLTTVATGWVDADSSRSGLYTQKGQRAQVALAFDHIVSSRDGFNRGELESEVEPAELRFRAGDMVLQERCEMRKLCLDPLREIPDLHRPGLRSKPLHLTFEMGDSTLALTDGFQDRRRRFRTAFEGRDEVRELPLLLALGGRFKTGNLWTGQNRQFRGGRDQ